MALVNHIYSGRSVIAIDWILLFSAGAGFMVRVGFVVMLLINPTDEKVAWPQKSVIFVFVKRRFWEDVLGCSFFSSKKGKVLERFGKILLKRFLWEHFLRFFLGCLFASKKRRSFC